MKRLLPLLAPFALVGAAPTGDAPILTFPLACTLGQDCAIQSYRDDDPGPGVKDYRCGGRSYPGHDGTDIRLTSMAQQRRGVAVLAAAAGIVRGTRDGEPDRSMRVRPAAEIAGRECGNGVMIAHPNGWSTQYCHMAQGSIAVRPGQEVAAGTVLGRVGLSGKTEFPHLHLTVRHGSDTVDPFASNAAAGQCGAGPALWRDPPGYAAGHILVTGFAAGPVEIADVQEAGATPQPRPGPDTPLVAFFQSIGLQAGDVQQARLIGPDGTLLVRNAAAPLERDKAQTLLFAGRRAPDGGWPKGEYRAEFEVMRAGRIAISASSRITL